MPFCSNCGKEIRENDRFCSYCGVSIGTDEFGLQTKSIDIAYPEVDSLEFQIVVRTAGRVNVSGGAQGRFIEGTIEYDVPELVPRIHKQSNRISIEQSERFTDRIRANPHNRWDLKLGGEKPFSMDVKCGVSMGHWVLGGLPITNLYLEAGVSSNTVTFDKTNPTELGLINISAGAGNLDVNDLLNANFNRMRIEGGVGDVKLNFTGEDLKRDTKVDIGGGVGSFRILVKESVPTRVNVEGLTSVNTRGSFTKRKRGGLSLSGEFVNKAYESGSGSALEIDIRMGVGSITLNTR